MKTLFEKTGGTYSVVGDYLIPNLTLSHQSKSFLGKYGWLRKTYLKEYKKSMYSYLIITGKLFNHLHEIDEQAQKMFDLLIKQMAEKQGVTKALKTTNQMAWVGAMNNIRSCAEEIVLKEIIYS
jgi:hypothetical protein